MSNTNSMREALQILRTYRVFITSREKAKAPEGIDLFDETLSKLEAELAGQPETAPFDQEAFNDPICQVDPSNFPEAAPIAEAPKQESDTRFIGVGSDKPAPCALPLPVYYGGATKPEPPEPPEALRDAERYRWLRNEAAGPDMEKISWLETGEEMDETIDIARGAIQASKGGK